MAGTESKLSVEQNRSQAELDVFGECIAPTVAFILVAGLFLALVGAMLVPANWK